MKRFIRDQAKRALTRVLRRSGLEIHAIPPPPSAYEGIPDAAYYTSLTPNDPHFSPWGLGGYGEFREYLEGVAPYTLVSPDRCHVLYSLGMQALQTLDGQFFECGVYRGGTAMLLARLVHRKRRFPDVRLHLFDTFEGMPETDHGIDLHRKGDFDDTSLESVRARVGAHDAVTFYPGRIPDTFTSLRSVAIGFAHVDVDIHDSVKACCEFIYPRLQSGGFLVFDDYGFPSCPGARQAVDRYFRDKREVPLVLPTGQAVVFRK